jgi:hypothetical protein
MELPAEIHRISAWRPEPGDVLIIQNTEIEITQQQAGEIKEAIKRQLRLPTDQRIVVLGRDWEFTCGKVAVEAGLERLRAYMELIGA